MLVHNHNLNIHYSVPDSYWEQLGSLYTKMPHWNETKQDCPSWYGETDDGKLIEVSVEPNGLSFYAQLPQEEWDEWFNLFKKEASEIMGYRVDEPEDGFEFVYFE